MRPVELGRLQPGETLEEHRAAVAAVFANLDQATRPLAAAVARAAAQLEEQMRLIGLAIANAVPADPDEPLWFDAMRPDPDAEVWTP